MNQYKYSITLNEKSEADAIMKIKALIVLASKLNASELDKLSDIVKNDPVKTAMAKSYLGIQK
jgi:hypothetical protein